MTTLREVKRMLTPLLARHADLALVGRWLVMTPVRHHLRAVLVDRTGSADLMNPRWLVYGLYDPRLVPFLNWGQLIYRPERGGRLWKTHDRDVSRDLCEEIERVALPILRPIESLGSFVAMIRKGVLQADGKTLSWALHHPDDKLYVAVALGDIVEARRLCKTYFDRERKPMPKDADVTVRKLVGIERIKRLLADDDRAGLATALHEWEAETIRNMKLEAYWQPSPFPIERA